MNRILHLNNNRYFLGQSRNLNYPDGSQGFAFHSVFKGSLYFTYNVYDVVLYAVYKSQEPFPVPAAFRKICYQTFIFLSYR